MRIGAVAVALLACACGGPVTLGPGGQGCTITLSGAAQGTFACNAVGAWASNNNTSGVALSPTQSGSNLNVALGWVGAFQTGTYKQSDANAQSGVSYTGTGNQAWLASSNSGSGQGSYTLTLTSSGTSIAGNGGNGYVNIHGTATATLAPVAGSGATGDVNLSATF